MASQSPQMSSMMSACDLRSATATEAAPPKRETSRERTQDRGQIPTYVDANGIVRFLSGTRSRPVPPGVQAAAPAAAPAAVAVAVPAVAPAAAPWVPWTPIDGITVPSVPVPHTVAVAQAATPKQKRQKRVHFPFDPITPVVTPESWTHVVEPVVPDLDWVPLMPCDVCASCHFDVELLEPI